MSHIAESGGRTVHNCMVYDARKVYEATLRTTRPVMQSEYGTGEVNPTGEWVTEDLVYHIVATSEALARALVAEKWGGMFHKATLTGIKVLFTLDGEINYGHR